MRADALRNYERLVAVAAEVVAEQGADASMEEIARRAGVGSATLHRHFGGRTAMLEAVFETSIDAVCKRAADLLGHSDPGEALRVWLQAVIAHAVKNRGLGAALLLSAERGSEFHARITRAGRQLLKRAQQHRAADAGATIADVLGLVNAISLTAERDAAQADRLLALAIRGVSPAAVS
ncbi:TetR/AcrR family transcriptional regulator [Kribbella catacumbae]|uniref:TetR/AcrR family transcriptional regulator n=1 Tax=Kribbella catacumbae TaxID=460086 RepID=UPI0003677D9E|nr:helix-turn-helix domain-containing protein [Kribbella catacumbae]